MIKNRSFRTSSGELMSNSVFHLSNGLQQGTINAPVLFNIYTSGVLSMCGINATETKAIAFADDPIVYTTDRKISGVQEILQDILHKLHNANYS